MKRRTYTLPELTAMAVTARDGRAPAQIAATVGVSAQSIRRMEQGTQSQQGSGERNTASRIDILARVLVALIGKRPVLRYQIGAALLTTEELADRIRRLREAERLTPADLARQLGKRPGPIRCAESQAVLLSHAHYRKFPHSFDGLRLDIHEHLTGVRPEAVYVLERVTTNGEG